MSLTQDTKDVLHNILSKYLFNTIATTLQNNQDVTGLDQRKAEKVAFELSQVITKNVCHFLFQGEKYLLNKRMNQSGPLPFSGGGVTKSTTMSSAEMDAVVQDTMLDTSSED